jgi:hypothetical protein
VALLVLLIVGSAAAKPLAQDAFSFTDTGFAFLLSSPQFCLRHVIIPPGGEYQLNNRQAVLRQVVQLICEDAFRWRHDA